MSRTKTEVCYSTLTILTHAGSVIVIPSPSPSQGASLPITATCTLLGIEESQPIAIAKGAIGINVDVGQYRDDFGVSDIPRTARCGAGPVLVKVGASLLALVTPMGPSCVNE
jgi:hypothetical protein